MKTMFTVLLVLSLSSNLSAPSDNQLEMQVDLELQFEKKVKVFDYDGNLLSEHLASEVINNEISVVDYCHLRDSDFAFDYLGDHYYFTTATTRKGS